MLKQLLLLLVILCSCSGNNPVAPKNMPPIITNVSLDYNSGGGGVFIQLTVTDPESDVLFYTWSANSGTLYASQDHARWVGSTKGIFSVLVTITDGVNTITKIIEVHR